MVILRFHDKIMRVQQSMHTNLQLFMNSFNVLWTRICQKDVLLPNPGHLAQLAGIIHLLMHMLMKNKDWSGVLGTPCRSY